jgi:hypothetical protein
MGSAQNVADLSEEESQLRVMSQRFFDDSSLAANNAFLFRVMKDTSIPVLYKDSLFASHRAQSVYAFIPGLVNALKNPGSFNYPFSDLRGISIQYPQDSSFRIFTWALKDQRSVFRHFGAIQMNSNDLKLFPLFDFSDTLTPRTQKVLSNTNWYGALYYRILQHEVNGKTHYTLFGFDQNDLWSRKKFLDVLSFDSNGKPVFGAPLFHQVKKDEEVTHNRFFIEYKKSASVNLNFFPNMDLIIFDHTAPMEEGQEGLYFNYIPDGTYEGFRWDEKAERWSWIEKVFHYAINENDNPPMPAPILDDRD